MSEIYLAGLRCLSSDFPSILCHYMYVYVYFVHIGRLFLHTLYVDGCLV